MDNKLFGPWPDVPRAQGARFVDAPLGELCLTCNEPIREGECGEIMPFIDTERTTLRPVHRECLMLRLVGHHQGLCSCTNYEGISTLREAALELDRRLIALRLAAEAAQPHWLSREEQAALRLEPSHTSVAQNTDGQWYFYDETGCEVCGPYPDQDSALTAIKQYAENL